MPCSTLLRQRFAGCEMPRNPRFGSIHAEINDAIDDVPPGALEARYTVAFRALITSIDKSLILVRNDELRRYWVHLVYILNQIDERITAEAVGGEEL